MIEKREAGEPTTPTALVANLGINSGSVVLAFAADDQSVVKAHSSGRTKVLRPNQKCPAKAGKGVVLRWTLGG